MGSSDPEDGAESFIDKALDEEGQGQRPGSELEHLEEFSEEYLFEDKAQEAAVADEPVQQESQAGSDEERLGPLTEGHLFEDKAWEPAVLDEQQEEESQPVFDLEDLEKFIEEPLFETKTPRPAVSDEPEEQESQPGSDQKSLEEPKEDYLFEDKAQEPAVPEEPEEQESQPGSDEERLGESKEDYEEGPEQAEEGETEVDTQEINLQHKKEREKGRRRMVASVAIVLIALIGIGAGYLYLKREGIAVSPNQGTGVVQSVSIAIPREEILALDSFVIPAEGNKDFTYVFLSISMKLPNKEVKREVAEKERSLRGIIYDTLVREIANTEDVPTPESLKEFIIRGVNDALSTGRISEVFISKFLAL
jgi:flagellar basal body-associated protein FliL